ncbi:MAG: ParB/RepB/Spo0J family partition protein [Planctomycetes bacterium]|nr:ParB/RepB/Spo0J family partition protein [Planctomycetota bacterium]
MERKARLGRGLDALLGTAEEQGTTSASAQSQITVDTIDQNPFQPRKTFDQDEIKSLSETIRVHGILQPLVVRQVGDRFQLIAGERRLRAAKAAGLAKVPVTVVDFNDQQVLEAALVENIHRSDLNPIEKAQGFKEYLGRFQMTHDQLANRLGLARSTVTNLVALLDLPPEVQEAVRVGQLSTGHAKLLKGVEDRERQVALSKEIVARGLSVHATEALIKPPAPPEKTEPEEKEQSAFEKTAHVQGIEDELRQKLSLKVDIRIKGKEKGQIVLFFETNEDFERVLEVLRR